MNIWFLIDASPDFREQLNRIFEIHPDPARGLRNTPVEDVIRTSADLDHVPVCYVREFTPVRIYVSGAAAAFCI
ncbi:MBL fold metallo-hydrolase [Tunturibacter empetritectus]|uniref:MBL fold metallo-hydrolase n=1 Tax=Tunturiibacter empetritectus TaxID=3069691 RepID=UPI001607CEAF